MKKNNVIKIVSASLVASGLARLISNRSLSSLLTEQALRLVKPFPEVTAERYQVAVKENDVPYKIPAYALKMGFHPWQARGDVLSLTKFASAQSKVIFYLHGGGFWQQPTYFHYRFLQKLARKLQVQVVMPIYPKIPVATAVPINRMVLDVYQELCQNYQAAAQVIVMGDSAGGGLALSLLEQLADLQLPQPRQAVLFSPWLDVRTNDPRMKAIQPNDHLLKIADLQLRGHLYAGSLRQGPLVAPLLGDLHNLAPITVFTGTHDILNVDAQRLEQRAAANAKITVITYLRMAHDFILFPIPEAKAALKQVVKIIN